MANYFGGTGNDLVLQWANTRVLAWGTNANGELGNGSTAQAACAVSVDMSGVLAGKTIIAAAAGGSITWRCVRMARWPPGGTTHYGQLGDGSTTNSKVPVLVNRTGVLAGKTVIAVAAGTSHSLALCADGTLAAWGYNYNGQLGNGSTTNSSVPVLVDRTGVLAGKTVVAIAAGDSHSLALVCGWHPGRLGQQFLRPVGQQQHHDQHGSGVGGSNGRARRQDGDRHRRRSFSQSRAVRRRHRGRLGL